MSRTDYESQFRQWLDEHTGLLVKVVRSFAASASDFDDLLQEVLLQVWMSIPSFRAESKATTWLYRVALNTALAWKRRETKHRDGRRALAVASAVTDDCGTPSDLHAKREAVDRLYEVVRALAPADRALVLLYLDGLSYSDMAEVIGISESNVGVRLNRVKKSLAAQLKETDDVA
ncbi:MAG: RNA polymerase sigma factor [Planctomycetes bacterium]|nr:RNA polymerase sigma factor [Planctomycetota bacterium]